MRPPTEVERLAVFLAAMTVTRLLLGRRARPPAYPCDSRGRPIEDGINGWLDPEPIYDYRARYGANNAREN